MMLANREDSRGSTALQRGLRWSVAALVVLFFWYHVSLVTSPWSRVSPGLAAKWLYSDEPGLIRDGLMSLTYLRDFRHRQFAVRLLEHEDPYVWLAAALYLGEAGEAASVPYLIKALRHQASVLKEDELRLLKQLTGQRYDDFLSWRDWWMQTHLGEEFDWNSHLGWSVSK